METEQQRGPGRPRRAEVTAQRRRRRSDEGLAPDKRLPIPPEIAAKLKAEGRMPRWVNAQGNRMHRFTVLDDYDPVEGVEPVPVGTDEAGNPIMAHLLSKPIELHQEDQAKAEERRSVIEQSLFKDPEGAEKAKGRRNPNPGTAERYLDDATKLGRGNQILEG